MKNITQKENILVIQKIVDNDNKVILTSSKCIMDFK